MKRAMIKAYDNANGWLRAALVLALCVAPCAFAQAEDEVDYVELASVLASDGEYERAEQALAQVDPAAEGVGLVRYHTVRGLIALERQRLELAARAFADAIAAGQTDPLIHLYRAQALFGLERFDEAIAALDAAGDLVEAIAGAWMMRAHAHWVQGRHQAALDTLSRAGQRFPGNHGFLRRQIFYLIEQGLNQEAARLGRIYLVRAEGKAEDYVAIGTALRRTRAFAEALSFLESAALRYPGNSLVAKALAQAWMEHGNPLAAAELLARQAESEPSLFAEAAELYRLAGQRARALQLNARVADPSKKLKQRVGILLEMRAWPQVVAMEAALYRAGLLEDEDLRYALAYSRFQGGDYEAAEQHLKTLKRPELFRKATELRKLMADCAETAWACT
ncbi:MAG TPA: tetratricopeptide repeat protein [Xanthomonadaceae bacterium]|nr:tetratricopeptide repeat protein [Xanthomonadaceae bacterium]